MDAISTGTVQVFYSYAHEDEALLRKLDNHLSALKREEKIASWYDRDIRAGLDWEQAIDERINTADIILLLISSDFIASNYCYSVEAKRAIERHYEGEARIIPIILRPVDWQRTPLGQFLALPRDGKPLSSYSDKDKACLEIVQGIRQVVDEMFEKHSFQHKHGQRVWTIPYDRNTFFTGRESILQKIYDVFTTGKNGALSGIGGVGKTQTALEYAYLHRNEYQTVLWARADTRELLTTDLAAFAAPLKIVGQRAEDQAYALVAVTQWLRNNTNWLLIIDNVEDIKILRDLLPTDAKGHILCTTQSQVTGIFQRIDLKEMGLEEGATFLLQRSRLFSSDISSESIPPDEIIAARTVVLLMGGLPLALDQAGAYIDEVGYNSLDDYRETYQQEEAHLLGRRSDDSTGHPSSVTTTISLALEKIKQANEVATELLSFYAFLHPDAIPDDIIAQNGTSLGLPLSSLATDFIKRDEAHGILRRYSLIRGNPTDKMFSMHRLIQVIVKDNMSLETQRSWAERVVYVINAAFPDVEFSTWQRCQRYIAQVQLCATYIEQWNFTFPEAARLLNEAGYYLYEVAQYADAESLLTRARFIREQTSEQNRLDLATTLNHLAELYQLQGRYAEAESLYQQSLAIREQQVGPGHPDTAISLNNLAILYYRQARYREAESLYLRALKIREQQLGETHTDFASSLHNLALLYSELGRYEEAETFYQRSLEIKEKQLGGEHPDTAIVLNSLSALYKIQEKYEEAEQLYQRSLTIMEKQLGTEHPNTAMTLSNLAQLYLTLRRYEEAEPIYQRALTIMEKQLGTEHPNTAVVLHNLATLYKNQKRYIQAKLRYEQALKIYEKQLGSGHPKVAYIIYDLATLYHVQRKFQQAEPFYQRAMKLFEQTLGEEHPDTINTLESYAQFLNDAKSKKRAENLQIRIEIIKTRRAEKEGKSS